MPCIIAKYCLLLPCINVKNAIYCLEKMYLKRKIDSELSKWRAEKEGKPLLIRGARQVGKSTAVRHLAGEFEHFLEVNFEARRQVHTIFEGDLDPKQICEQLSLL